MRSAAVAAVIVAVSAAAMDVRVRCGGGEVSLTRGDVTVAAAVVKLGVAVRRMLLLVLRACHGGCGTRQLGLEFLGSQHLRAV